MTQTVETIKSQSITDDNSSPISPTPSSVNDEFSMLGNWPVGDVISAVIADETALLVDEPKLVPFVLAELEFEEKLKTNTATMPGLHVTTQVKRQATVYAFFK